MSARLLRLVTLRDDLVRQAEELTFRIRNIESLLVGEIVEEQDQIRRGWTQTGMSGAPCEGPILHETLTHECYIPSPEEHDEPPAMPGAPS